MDIFNPNVNPVKMPGFGVFDITNPVTEEDDLSKGYSDNNEVDVFNNCAHGMGVDAEGRCLICGEQLN